MHDTVSLYPIWVSGSANGPIMGQLLDAMEVFDAVDAVDASRGKHLLGLPLESGSTTVGCFTSFACLLRLILYH